MSDKPQMEMKVENKPGSVLSMIRQDIPKESMQQPMEKETLDLPDPPTPNVLYEPEEAPDQNMVSKNVDDSFLTPEILKEGEEEEEEGITSKIAQARNSTEDMVEAVYSP